MKVEIDLSEVGKPKFYEFWQNNSGGVYDDTWPLGASCLIEADNAEDANRRAEAVGIYFDGVYAGKDCECCGNRWRKAWEDDYTYELPEIEGRSWVDYTPEVFAKDPKQFPSYVVLYKDGRVMTLR